MRAQATIDALVTGAGLLAISIVILSAFYGLYTTAEKGIRIIHMKYLSQVIEDRMRTCPYIDNAKVYAPYEVNVLCNNGKLCWRDLCVEVNCVGGGTGRTFVIRECVLTPVFP